MKSRPISVLLTTDGTYPFYTGGVSKWCDLLTHGLPETAFQVQAIVTNPYPEPKYEFSPNVHKVIKVPQWGLLQPAEFSQHLPTSLVLQHMWDTTGQVIAMQFKPARLLQTAALGGLGYLMLSIALHDMVILSSVNSTSLAMIAAAFGLAVNLVTGYALSHYWGVQYAAAGLLAGSAVLLWICHAAVRHVLRRPDYHYAIS